MGQSSDSTLELPRLLLGEVAWSFSEPIPQSLEEFTRAVSAYAHSIGETGGLTALANVFPMRGIDVHFSVWSRPAESGGWTETRTILPLRFPVLPTYVALLFDLHRAAFLLLRDADKRFFEGLELMNEHEPNGMPSYYLALGS